MNRVLVFEPDARHGDVLKERLQSEGQWVVLCSDPVEAEQTFRKQHFQIALWRVDSERSAEAFYTLKNHRPQTAIIAFGDSTAPSLIVNCMRAGAAHYWAVPMGEAMLQQVLSDTLSRVVSDFDHSEDFENPVPGFIGRSPRIVEIFRLLYSIKNTDSTILISGESGTGKEVVARAIHELSNRRKGNWIAVNCGAIPASLLESELFGHVKGAFTGATQNRTGRFQLAGNGSLFLDEISELPFDLQVKLLRAIQSREFEPVGGQHSVSLDARIIAATNQDLEQAVAERRFREDLYYRLNVIPIFVPPLRSRKSDIPLLARHFIEKFSKSCKREFKGISEEAMGCLVQYHWPGNVRELENLMERVVVLKRDEGIIETKDLPIHHFKNVKLDRFVANVALPEEGLDLNEALNDFENELILQALQKTDGNKNRAATLLNLNRTTLVEKLKRKGLRISC